MNFDVKKLFVQTIAMLALVVVSPSADAQTVPWNVFGTGGSDADGFSIFGEESFFGVRGFSFPTGRYRGPDGIAIADPASVNPEFNTAGDLTGFSGNFFGEFDFINRRSGDRLKTTFGNVENGARSIGTFQTIPVGRNRVRVLFIAEFNPVVGQSTGAFQSVTAGSVVLYALTEPLLLSEFDLEAGRSPRFKFNWIGFGRLTFGSDDDD